MIQKSTSLVFLLIAEDAAIQEIGDLNSVELYSHEGNKFTTDKGWEVVVDFFPLPQSSYSLFGIPSYLKSPVNVGYRVEGEETQFKKSDYRELIRILKTVLDLTLNHVSSHPEVDALLVLPANKDRLKVDIESDYQKHVLYKVLATKHMSKLGKEWTLRDVTVRGHFMDGFLLFKKQFEV